MMKRLQSVRGTSLPARAVEPAGGVGGSGGAAASIAARSARGRSTRCGALEVEIVIPDFSVGGARPRRATGAHDTHRDALCLRPRRELYRGLLPLVCTDGNGLRHRERVVL